MAVEDRINELETRVAFQEESLQKLDEALADQQKQLSTLEYRIKVMTEQLLEIDVGNPDPEDEKPPHY